MNTGNIVFARDKSPLSRFIRWFDGNGKWSHVAIAVSPYHVLESQYFTTTRIKLMDYTDYEIIDLQLSQQKQHELVIQSISYIGKRYDYKQILWYLFAKLFKWQGRNEWNSANALICSEEVENILRDIGVIPFEYTGDKTPNQLYTYLKNK